MKTSAEVFEYYDQLSRVRALTDAESLALERSMIAKEKADFATLPEGCWTEAEDETLRRGFFSNAPRRVTAWEVGRSVFALYARRRLLIKQCRFYAQERAG